MTSRRSWVLLVVLAALGAALIGGVGHDNASGDSPESLPHSAQSARVERALAEFPDAGVASAIAVVTRVDAGQLTEADRSAAAAAVARGVAAGAGGTGAAGGLRPAPDGGAVIGQIPVPSDLSGRALTDGIDRIRAAAHAGSPRT